MLVSKQEISDPDGMSRVLLCPPDWYGVTYEINPWMKVAQAPDLALARRQWVGLHEALHDLGHEVETVPPRSGWPDMVFTANAGVVMGRQVLLSRFRHPERAGESLWHQAWFEEHDFEVSSVEGAWAFEGEGDVLRWGTHWVAAYGFRTDLEAHASLADWAAVRLTSVELIAPRYYHLDTCFCPLDEKLALWHPPAFAAESQNRLRGLGGTLLAVPQEEDARFACNAVVLDRHVLLPDGCPQTIDLLRDHGFIPHALPMSEFIKAGGACKCLVLILHAA